MSEFSPNPQVLADRLGNSGEKPSKNPWKLILKRGRERLHSIKISALETALAMSLVVTCISPAAAASESRTAYLPFASKNATTLTGSNLEQTFSRLSITREEQEQRPQEVYDFFLEKDEEDNVISINFVARDYTPEDRGEGRKLYRSLYNPQTKEYSRLYSSPSLPIAASSLSVLGEKILVGGEFPIGSDKSAALLSEDRGKNYSALNLPIQGAASEQLLLPKASKALVNIFGVEMDNTTVIFDFNKKTLIRTNGASTGSVPRDMLSLGSVSIDGSMVTVYSTAYDRSADTGIIGQSIDLHTARTEAFRKFQNLGNIEGLFPIRINLSSVDSLLLTNSDRRMIYAANPNTEGVLGMSFEGWVRDVPNYGQSHSLTGIQMYNGIIDTAGGYQTVSGESRPLVFSWPSGKDPNRTPEILKTYRPNDSKRAMMTTQKSLDYGKFNGIPGMIVNLNRLGLVIIEKDPNGQPLENPRFIYLGKGIGEENPIP